MARRVRRETPEGEFEDPLKNYDPPEYSDALERVLMEDSVASLRTKPVARIAPDTPVETAMGMMAEHGIASVLVVDEQDNLLGVFSERDVLNRVADRLAELRSQPVSQVMTEQPLVVHETDSPGTALNLMAVQGFRHVPILNVDEKLVGVLGPRRITDYLQEQFRKQQS